MISGIYCIENLQNGRAYIGQSNDIKKRWTQHRSDLRAGRHDNEHLQRAWEKYGEDCFSFYIVEEVAVDMLDIAEEMWIEVFDAYGHGYNMTLGGESTRGLPAWNKGIPRSEKVKEKLRESAKKRTGEKNPFFNKKHSDETKQRIRELRSEAVYDAESGTLYYSAKFADMMFGGKSSNVSKALSKRNKAKSAYGITWKKM